MFIFHLSYLSGFSLIGDISVVAALGDGIVAGKGALADNIADMSIEYKGVSFATGITFLDQ